MPGERLQAAPIDFQATLQEAHEALARGGGATEALYVRRPLGNGGEEYIYGVLTREDVERGYRPSAQGPCGARTGGSP